MSGLQGDAKTQISRLAVLEGLIGAIHNEEVDSIVSAHHVYILRQTPAAPGKAIEMPDRFRELYEKSPNATALLDCEWKLTDANRAFLDMFSAGEAAEMRGSARFLELIPDERIREQAAAGETVSYFLDFNADGAPAGSLARQGTMCVNVTITALCADASGACGYMLKVHDFTETRMARERMQFQGTLLDSSRDAILAMDLDGRIAWWSKGAERMFGYSEADMAERSIFMLQTSESRSLEDMMESVRSSGAAEGEHLLKTRGGALLWGSASMTLVRNADDEAGCIVGTIQDISERRSAQQTARDREKQLEALSRKMISIQEEERASICRDLHDQLGQLITALGFEVGVLEKRQTVTPEDLTDLSRLIGEVQTDLQRIYMGLRPLGIDKLGLEGALKSLVYEYGDRCGMAIKPDIDVRACEMAKGQAIPIYRILQESLTNAARHSGAKQLSISLRRAGANIVMDVQDDGVGFMPDAGMRTGGLGLVGMKERAAMAGGELDIFARPGQGTRIRLRMPAEDA